MNCFDFLKDFPRHQEYIPDFRSVNSQQTQGKTLELCRICLSLPFLESCERSGVCDGLTWTGGNL